MIKPTYFFQKIKMYVAVNIIYKNIILYNFVIYLLRHINLFLPHENDIYGLRYLKLNRNNKIVDIGASDGLYFRSVRSIGIKNSFVCFEPLPINRPYLKKLSKVGKLKFHSLALGNKNSTLKLYTFKYKNILLNNYSSFSKKKCLEKIKISGFNVKSNFIEFICNKVKQKKLDEFKIKTSLIKIDTEGYEKNVISGSLMTIKKSKPAIRIEYDIINKDTNTLKFILKKISKYQYKPYIFDFYNRKFVKFYQKKIKVKDFFSHIYFLRKSHLIQ